MTGSPPRGVRLQLFRGDAPHEPYRVSHDLHESNLFERKALARVAAQFSTDEVPSGSGSAPEASPCEVIAGIADTPGWAVLRDSCWDGPHERCSRDLFAQIEAGTRAADPGLHDPQMSAIVTSTEAVTPLHLDIDDSFLLQVQGWKTIVFVPDHVVPDGYLRAVLMGTGGRLALPDEVRPLSRKFVIGPGEGVHVPFGWPHFTRVDIGPSVSVSCAFQTRRTAAIRSTVP